MKAILYAVEGVRDAISGEASALDVLDAIKPLLLEYGQSEGVLTDDRRDAIQARVLDALYEAKLIPTADFQ